MRRILSILLLLKLGIPVLTSDYVVPTYRQDDGTVDEDFVWEIEDNVNWKNFMAGAEKYTDAIIQYLQPRLLSVLSSVNVSDQCAESLIAYTEGIKKWEPWAVQMVDATGRIPSGFVMGSKIDFGSFEECLAAKREGHGKELSFQGQFCMLGYKSPLIAPMHVKTPHGKDYIDAYGEPPDWIVGKMKEQAGILRTFGLWIGTCIPSTCSKQDIRNLFSNAFKPWASLVSLTDCQVDSPKNWPLSAKIAGCILLLLSGVCLLGTVLDLQYRDSPYEKEVNENFLIKQLKTFSVYANSKKLLDNNARKSPLDCLYGIRFLLCIWVLGDHIVIFPEYWKEVKYGSYGDLLKFENGHLIFFENPFVPTGSFCTLSGFLMVYSLLKKLEKDGKLGVMKFFFQKYFRLMPSFFFIALLTYIVPVINSGPIWKSTWEFEHSKCETNWWKNLLLINNFSQYDDICIIHTWYISLSIQLQIIGIFLMILTYRYPKLGLSLGVSAVLISFYIDYRKALFYKIPSISINYAKDFRLARTFVNGIYMQPFHHISSFTVGMILGWIMVKHKDLKLPKIILVVGWIISITLYLAVLFGIKVPITDYKIMAYPIVFRNVVFNISLSWIMYCCMTGNGGILDKFLSHKLLIPLSQISYCIFLIHPIIMLYRGAALHERTFMSVTDHIFEFSAVFLITLFISYIAHISVELPFSTMYNNFVKSNSLEGVKKHSIINEKNE